MTLAYHEALAAKYKSLGILVDTNLLLLYLIGRFNPRLISQFKRTQKYIPEDFELLRKFITYFDTIVTTPHILTEVSNLSGQLPDEIRRQYFGFMSSDVRRLTEKYRPSAMIAALSCFSRLGLTDAAVVELAPGSHLVLTDDLPLYAYLTSTGVDALNFNHIRASMWQ